jgi:membrane-associated phospholipid phosphatase
MHCAFAMMIGATGFQVCRNGFAKGFWACWPFLVAWVTIVTANHYWVDAVLGWGVALTSAVVAHRLARARPEVWAFRPRVPREAEA